MKEKKKKEDQHAHAHTMEKTIDPASSALHFVFLVELVLLSHSYRPVNQLFQLRADCFAAPSAFSANASS